jgi:hypothetical protein
MESENLKKIIVNVSDFETLLMESEIKKKIIGNVSTVKRYHLVTFHC